MHEWAVRRVHEPDDRMVYMGREGRGQREFGGAANNAGKVWRGLVR